MIIRMQSWSSLLLCMRGSFHLWENYFKTRPAARTRVNGEVTANGFYALFYYRWAVAVVFEVSQREASHELGNISMAVGSEFACGHFRTSSDSKMVFAPGVGGRFHAHVLNVV